MTEIQQFIRDLATYAFAKKGARQSSTVICPDVLDYPHVTLPALFGDFFRVDSVGYEDYVAEMPVFAKRLRELRKQYPVIKKTPNWVERDGHIQMEVPLDANLPIDFIKSLIDESYDLVWNKVDAEDRLKILLAGLPYDEPKLIDRLIEMRGLKAQRAQILEIARHAILLVTKKSSEVKIPLGATKIGGRPDLPANIEWPTYRDGRPLAFLVQINLEEIVTLQSPLRWLPPSGLLSVFSAWGWTNEDDSDPRISNDTGEGTEDQNGWTVILHTPSHAALDRRKTPRGVNSFKAAAVESVPALSFPNHRTEPSLQTLGFNDNEYDLYDEMQSDFRSVQSQHWLKSSDSYHLLGGYALFQQQFPDELLGTRLTMFLQVGTDGKAGMCWGDGGELTFYVDAEAMKAGRLDRVWGTCQGG